MSLKKQVRVIKKAERNRQETPVEKITKGHDTAREMVQTVTNWVNELQQRRRSEAANAIKTLLSKSPRPSEA
jgi:hypothetical protein